MKRMLLVVCLLVSSQQTVFSDWKLGKIYNNSDLTLDSAWRHKNTGQKRSIPAITAKIKPSLKIIDINYTISQKLGTISISAHYKNQFYDIFFDRHPTHSLQWQRSKTQANDKSCSIEDGSHCARVWMKLADGKDAAASFGYDDISDEPMITLDVTIQGKNGSYSLFLAEPNE
ncbi:MAG TPA: hypothetical protein VLG50_02335 [Candidatus Saccharimonadales bacterium]|nr:hypothetical protein [Candidatus Saccharimonadales bacterium]